MAEPIDRRACAVVAVIAAAAQDSEARAGAARYAICPSNGPAGAPSGGKHAALAPHVLPGVLAPHSRGPGLPAPSRPLPRTQLPANSYSCAPTTNRYPLVLGPPRSSCLLHCVSDPMRHGTVCPRGPSLWSRAGARWRRRPQALDRWADQRAEQLFRLIQQLHSQPRPNAPLVIETRAASSRPLELGAVLPASLDDRKDKRVRSLHRDLLRGGGVSSSSASASPTRPSFHTYSAADCRTLLAREPRQLLDAPVHTPVRSRFPGIT